MSKQGQTTRRGGVPTKKFGNVPTPKTGGLLPAPKTGGMVPAPKFGNVAAPKFGNVTAPKFGNVAAPKFGNVAAPKFGNVAAARWQPGHGPATGLVWNHGHNASLIRGPRWVFGGGRSRRLIAITAFTGVLAAVVLADTTYYADAYVGFDAPLCTGVTDDGCPLRLVDVPAEDGDTVPQCVQYCAWAAAPAVVPVAAVPVATRDACAGAKQVNAVSGQEVRLNGHVRWNVSDCSEHEPPAIRVLQAPQHGEMFTKLGMITARTSVSGDNRCLGKTMNGVNILYRSAPDFVGVECIGYTAQYSSGAQPNWYLVNVTQDTATLVPRPDSNQIPSTVSAAQPLFVIQSVGEAGGKCVGVKDGRLEPGAQLAMNECTGASDQVFSYDVTSGQLKLGKLCMMTTATSQPGDPVRLGVCQGEGSQAWTLDLGGNVGPIVGVSGLCSDIYNGSKEAGAIVDISACQSVPNQSFAIRSVAAN